MIHINKIKKTYIPPTVDVVDLSEECEMIAATANNTNQENDGEEEFGKNDAKIVYGVDFSSYFAKDFEDELEIESKDNNYGW